MLRFLGLGGFRVNLSKFRGLLRFFAQPESLDFPDFFSAAFPESSLSDSCMLLCSDKGCAIILNCLMKDQLHGSSITAICAVDL